MASSVSDTDPPKLDQTPVPTAEPPSSAELFGAPVATLPEPPPPPMDVILKEAIAVAEDCGLKQPFTISGPERVDYPHHGHGYFVTIKEQNGKGRMGTARFTAEGKPSYWSLDTFTAG